MLFPFKRGKGYGSGLTNEITMKELAHVIVAGAGLFTPASDAGPGLGVALQKVQRHLAKHRPVACSRPVSNATLVLVERHIEYPMQAVFNGPVAAGLTHEITVKELAHVIVVPAGLFAPASDASPDP